MYPNSLDIQENEMNDFCCFPCLLIASVASMYNAAYQ